MRSPDALRAVVLCCVLWAGTAATVVAADEHRPGAGVERVQAARKSLREDPNVVRWREVGRFKPKESSARDGAWQMPLFEILRVLVWVGGGLLLAWVLWRLKSWVTLHPLRSVRRLRPAAAAIVSTSQRETETLPARLGAQAWGLWLANDPRAALSLLYRGVVSRLTHDHALPISRASTEQECLRMASAALAAGPRDYVAQVVSAWQLAGFGAQVLEASRVQDLCLRFDDEFARGPAAPTGVKA